MSARFKAILAAGIAGAILGAAVALRASGSHHINLDVSIQPLWGSLALYIVFSLYWTRAARNSAPTQSAEHWSSTLLHQLLSNASLLLMFLRITGLTGRWLPVSAVWVPLGLAIQAAAMAFAFWARRHLGRNWSAEVSAKVDHQLIRSGPYARLRHPIYTGVFGMHLGIAIASGEWHALLGFALLPIAYARKIRLEERNMRRLFGVQYDDYRGVSWALIPWVL